MLRFARLIVFGILTILVSLSLAHAEPEKITATPNPAFPGQAVTLRWAFSGKKVVVSGGRFGKGKVITGQKSLTDRPRQSTRYEFDVWTPDANAPKTLQKNRYAVIVEVLKPITGMSTYRAARGWQVSYLKNWKLDRVNTPDEGPDGLVYFQEKEDSVERLAVAVMAIKPMTCSDLMDKVRVDMPERYDNVEVISEKDTVHQGLPARLAIFQGMDRSHPGVKTQSIVLTFIRGNRGFVISARTAAARFPQRLPVLQKMIRSIFVATNPAVTYAQWSAAALPDPAPFSRRRSNS